MSGKRCRFRCWCMSLSANWIPLRRTCAKSWKTRIIAPPSDHPLESRPRAGFCRSSPIGAHAMLTDGLVTIPSSHGPEETMNRLETEVRAKGMTVFARIDHAAGATAVGLSLRPTEVLIFGNPKGGTPLMNSVQTVGLD